MGQHALTLCLASLLLLSCSEGERLPGDEVLATVNGETLTARDLRLALDGELGEGSQGLPDPEWLATRQRQVLSSLIDKRLLRQAAKEHGIAVREEELDKAVLRLRAEYPGEAFEELLAKQKITMGELRNRLRHQLTVERLFAKEVYSRVAVTDQEIAAWIAAHPEAVAERPERVRASQIVVRTEEEAKDLLARLRAGASFAELAMKHSLSPDARVGGDLGWFARGEMPPPFDEVCFQLPPGRLSDVVESAYGFHVFLVQEKQRAENLDEGERSKKAEATLLREKSVLAQNEFVRGLREAAKIDVNEKALSRVGTQR